MTERPLIAHVLYRLDTGGMERIVVSLIHATRDRYRHAVITLSGFGALREEIEDTVSACVSLDKRPGKDWGCYLRLWRVLRSLQPDLVQTYNLGTLDMAPIVRLSGVRRLVHAEHGRDAADPDGTERRYHRLRRIVAPFISRHVAVSADLQTWLTQRVGIRADKVVYIPNGVDLAVYYAGAAVRNDARPLLGNFAPPGSVLFANVARLDAVKDHAGLLAAFRRLRQMPNGDNARLVIAGDGPERPALDKQVAELGLGDAVRLLGNRRDVAQLLAECDVFVLSSIAEGMPVTVLEAMAAGLPVVSTDVGGVASVVTDGATGTLVRASDANALAAAMAAYAASTDRRRQHGAAGRARAVAHFSLAAMVSAYVRLYDELLGQRAGAVRADALAGLAGHKEN
jgi:sugar transferase (PEP-CTERM/EpsH1 system associated)